MNNAKLFFTPTKEELLIAIINNEKIYTKDGSELQFPDYNFINNLYMFITMNDCIDNTYYMNNELYKLEYNEQ